MPATFPDGMPAISPTTVAQILRRLPTSGEIRVRPGSRIEPDDLVGQCSIQRPPLLLDIAGVLAIQPKDLPRRMKAKVGAHVAFRDMLARRGRKMVLAPANGMITDVDATTGFIMLAPDPEPTSVSAGIRGYVAAVDGQRSATIETAAAVIQGMFGVGAEQWGLLRLLATDPGDVITAEMIDARCAYAIIIGGAGITAEALQKAQTEQVKGVIVGSIAAVELRQFLGSQWHGDWQRALSEGALAMPSPEAPTLLLTEGFGATPMSRPIFDLLTRFDRQEAFLQAQTRLNYPEQRPRLIIPIQRIPGGEAAPPPLPTLRQGSVVRVEDEVHRGMVGKVIALSEGGRLPSGVRTAIATVQVGAEERIMVPQSTLQVIE
ncbi:MAG: hypothetical protein H0X37_26980 [Herpetosiphonaceae bacterium]|nr:hypothetical protein [Herpetosiphonaceae bacterium]